MSAKTFALKSRAAIESSENAGDRVLVDTHTATLCSSNDSGWVILDALQNGATLDELVTLLGQVFSVEEQQARQDAMVFIRRLASIGLIDER